jgi:CheY-like chemotaxis protein
MCGVSFPTVIKWIDSGLLKGYRIPGSNARRITRQSLEDFAAKHNIPILQNGDDESTGPMQVLAVDDDKDIIDLITDAFDDGEIEVHTAQSGFEAGVRLATIKPAAVILDIKLPDLDGREVCKIVRSSDWGKKTRIIGITAYRDRARKEDLLKQGFDDLLYKPFSVEDLRERVESMVGLRRRSK